MRPTTASARQGLPICNCGKRQSLRLVNKKIILAAAEDDGRDPRRPQQNCEWPKEFSKVIEAVIFPLFSAV